MKAQISKTWAIHPGSKQPGFLADKALKQVLLSQNPMQARNLKRAAREAIAKNQKKERPDKAR